MRINNKLVISSIVALSLLSATSALADAQVQTSTRVNGDRNLGIRLGSLVNTFFAHAKNDIKKDVSSRGDRTDNSTTTPPKRAHDSSLNGKVTAINGTTLTVTDRNGTAFAVNTSGATLINVSGATATFTDIKVDDSVTVKGSLTGSVMTATKVRDRGVNPAPVVNTKAIAVGSVSSASSNSFTMSPAGSSSAITVTTDAKTIFRGVANAQALTSGESVLVLGKSSTTTPGTISASFVLVVQHGFAFLKDLFSTK